MENNVNQKMIDANSIFETGFLYGKALYLYCFQKIPSAHYMNAIDGEKVFHAIQERFNHLVRSVHGYKYYDNELKQYRFDETFIIMENNCILEFDTNYMEIYHNGDQQEFINECTTLATPFKEKQRQKPLEINLIIRGRNGLELRSLEVKPNELDIDLFYENDFKGIHEVIIERLSTDKNKGIVLLHGLPGTGKTTYLRYLIGKIEKRILFVSPNVASDITNPDFIQLLVDNPNSVLIIEDAENVIMDRNLTNNASVSNLLNISDGLLADFLNVQLICTFNSSLTLIDSALMRKGRLIAKYEFGKLNIEKAQRLSDHFGFNTKITKAMTIAEIANPDEKEHSVKRKEVIGFFRKHDEVLN